MRPLKEITDRYSQASIAVIGDICLDIYYFLTDEQSEISVETGLKTYSVADFKHEAGGAGNVAVNLKSLGAKKVDLYGILGCDSYGTLLIDLLSKQGVECSSLQIQKDEWQTHVYHKLYKEEKEQPRLDIGNFNRVNRESVEKLLQSLESNLYRYQAVIINEQALHGCHTPLFQKRVAKLIETYQKDCLWISDCRNLNNVYRGTLRKLNNFEALKIYREVCGKETPAPEESQLVKWLADHWSNEVVMTLGEEGAIAADREGVLFSVPGINILGAKDSVGAGDAFLSALSLTLATKGSLKEGIYVGNCAASVSVTKLYETGHPTVEEVLHLGQSPDFLYNPKLAACPAKASYLKGTPIEIINIERVHPPQVAIFDHDGTISTLRQGWEPIMKEVIIEAILGKSLYSAPPETFNRVELASKEMIDKTTGVQTITQMHYLREMVKRFGLVGDKEILSAKEYKQIYNQKLLRMVDERVALFKKGMLNQSDVTIKGILPFLKRLSEQKATIYLASGTDQQDVQNEATILGYAHYFNGGIFGSTGDAKCDPKQMVIESIIRELPDTISPAECCVFGDGPVEMREAAKRNFLRVGVMSDEKQRYGANKEKRSRLILGGSSAVNPGLLMDAGTSRFSQVEDVEMGFFDRSKITYSPLALRQNRVEIDKVSISEKAKPSAISETLSRRLDYIAKEIREARKRERSVILAFGAHTIKNGLGQILSLMIKQGWVTHLATNGAGVIHDWEFAWQGSSSEDVRTNVEKGTFGTWEETGLYINLALAAGSFNGLGYGESVGAMICNGGIEIPTQDQLWEIICSKEEVSMLKRAAAADFLELIQSERLSAGWFEIKHPFADYSVQACAWQDRTPLTSHPMFGHDIIYTHRANRGAVIGRCAERDFLSFVHSVSQLEGGVYLSVGSAVMSPMIFEKALSMARNVAQSSKRDIKNCAIHVIDLQKESWDWNQGEPPVDNPAYYLRFMKTFNRMGCPVDYTSIDNRDFFLHLYQRLEGGV